MVVVVVVVIFLINQVLYMAKLLHVARNIDGALVIKPELFLSFLQHWRKQRMINVNHRDYDPLLLLSLTHHNCYAPLGNIFPFSLPMVLMVVVVVVKMGSVQMEIQEHFVSTTHFKENPDLRSQKKKTKNQK
ncbi:hypothetical protein ACR8KM_22575 [Salmonella enterica subsp. enterica serovar Paratyphi A]